MINKLNKVLKITTKLNSPCSWFLYIWPVIFPLVSESNWQRDFSLRQRHCMVVCSAVNGGVAIRNTMIPALAHYLTNSAADEDMFSIFLKAHYSVQSDRDVISSGMVAVFISTLDKKLSLKKGFKENTVATVRSSHWHGWGAVPINMGYKETAHHQATKNGWYSK